jgi:hypothetical protein
VMNGETQKVAVAQSAAQQLVCLLEKSVAAWEKVGSYSPEGAENKLYSYMDYIEKRVVKEMLFAEGTSAICDAWYSLGFASSEDYDPEDVADLVRLANPRLPARVKAELGRRAQVAAISLAEARPIYDDILEFLDLAWAFDFGQPGCCADPIDKEFLKAVDSGDADPYCAVVGEYKDPFGTVDGAIALGSATADEAEKLIALARTVNLARMEYRVMRHLAKVAAAGPRS